MTQMWQSENDFGNGSLLPLYSDFQACLASTFTHPATWKCLLCFTKLRFVTMSEVM